MKKILFSFLLISFIFVNYVSANTSDVSQIKVTADIVPEAYKDSLSNGYVARYNTSTNIGYLLILNDSTGKFYGYNSGGDSIRYIGATVSVASFKFNNSTGVYDLTDSSLGPSNLITELTYTGNVPNISDCNVPIYTDSTCSEVFFESISQPDTTIANPDSKLQLTYEYNEDFTECKINATLADGAFTDKIYYSNYQPGVTGELLSKKGFPTERNNSYRKPVFIFSSRR